MDGCWRNERQEVGCLQGPDTFDTSSAMCVTGGGSPDICLEGKRPRQDFVPEDDRETWAIWSRRCASSDVPDSTGTSGGSLAFLGCGTSLHLFVFLVSRNVFWKRWNCWTSKAPLRCCPTMSSFLQVTENLPSCEGFRWSSHCHYLLQFTRKPGQFIAHTFP